MILPDLERFIRSAHPVAAAVRQLLEDRNTARAEADCYREMFAAVVYPVGSQTVEFPDA